MDIDHRRIDTPRSVLPALPTPIQHHNTPVLVVGGGAAGLSAALRAAQGTEVTVLARGNLAESNSAWAQGGIAAALDAADSPRLHIEDTLIAGAGLSDPVAVEVLAWEAPDLMHAMAALGVPFERDAADRFALGLEGGHSKRRILHVGDTSGWALTDTLIKRAQAHPRIHILEDYQAVDLLGDKACTGVLALDSAGNWHQFNARATILATGGAGALYGLTSNQPVALGEGIALAYRAGAEVADMEFVQFHPTVMRCRDGQGFLISEAARGEGGRLLTVDGERFMPAYDPRGELAPRDVVTRGIFAAIRRSGSDHVLLDLTHLTRDYLEQRFPTISSRCRAEGFDPATMPIPVAPAAHYLMGGIRTDLDGASSLPGLYAAGECACTGVHGANRLASNSLLECLVFGRRAGAAALQGLADSTLHIAHWRVDSQSSIAKRQAPIANPQPPLPDLVALTAIMRAYAGPLRMGEGLRVALAQLDALKSEDASITFQNALLCARLIVTSALLREESRGAHFRADWPQTVEAWRVHTVLSRGQAPLAVETIAEALSVEGLWR